MSRPTATVLAAIIATVLFALPPGANARPPMAPPERLPTTDQIRAVRAAYGLRADTAHIASISTGISPLLGIPLSPSEEQEMQRRDRVQEGLGSITTVGAAEASAFGGLYLDQSAGGVVDIALTAAATPAVQSAFQAAAPREATLRFRTVSYSLAELNAVHAELQVLAATERQDVQEGIETISTDIRANRVRVAVAKADRPRLEPLLADRFGNRIVVVDAFTIDDEVCNSRTSCTPYRAGIQIYPPPADTAPAVS